MAENTKTPPNQDQRQRTPQGGDAGKPQKPGGPMPSSSPDRGRQGVNQPKPEIDPDRDRSRGRPMPPGKDNIPGVDDLDDDDSTQRMDRE